MPPPLLAAYKFYGLNRGEHEGKTGIWYREWAPGAKVGAGNIGGHRGQGWVPQHRGRRLLLVAGGCCGGWLLLLLAEASMKEAVMRG